jgi:transposase
VSRESNVGALPVPLQFMAAWVGAWLGRHQTRTIAYLRAENRALREQLGGRRIRLTDAQRRRLAELGKAVGRKGLGEVATVASPDTILKWYRELVAKKYDGSAKRGPGRPRKPAEMVKLVVRMAQENPRWGYTRIRGALANLGHEIGRNTIKRVLREEGIDPAPERGKRYSWATFIKAHLGAIAAADFFTAEVMTLVGLVRLHVFFVIDIVSRKVEIAGLTANPTGGWMQQIARNLLDVDGGFLVGKRYLLLDRDPLYTKEFRAALKQGGRKVIRLPPRSPNLNAYAERFVLSIRSECLDRIVPMGERHLRSVVSEYMEHYHGERNHQGLENRLINAMAVNDNGRVRRRERLGGLLNFYYREAA